MKASRGILLCIMAAFLVFSLSLPAQAADKPYKLDIALMPEHEAFLVWWAKDQGWDKEEGLEFTLHYFNTGMDELEALPAKQWVIGGTGSVPALVGALRYNTYIFGIANDESLINGIHVRPDSPVLKTKGANPKYPDMYGTPELAKGKTFLSTQSSSQHYSLYHYLKALGLTEKDIVFENMDFPQVLAAFDSGIGDFAGVLPPWMYTSLQRGNKIAYVPNNSGAVIPLDLIGEKELCDKNPEIVVKFLRTYLRAVNMIKAEKYTSPKLIKAYLRFWTEWAGYDMAADMAKMDMEFHPVYDINEQLAIFDASKGACQMQQWEEQILEFFVSQGRFTKDEAEKLKKTSYVTDKFLKMTAESIKAKPLGGYTLP